MTTAISVALAIASAALVVWTLRDIYNQWRR